MNIPEAKIQKWMADICSGLQYIHSQHIIHGDIKPANILLDDKGNAKIADFGTSTILEHTSEKTTMKGGNTKHYVGPEMCEGKPHDRAVDIWALGCVIYELCTLDVFCIYHYV